MKQKTPLQKAWSIATTVIVVIVVLFAALLVGGRFFGIQVYSVISGSMEPEYPVGSLIYVKKVSPLDVKAGDVITYILPNETPCTHRVVRIDLANQEFYTKGDNNDIEDTNPTHFNNLIGKPMFKLPLLGYVAFYIQHPPGRYIAIAAGALLVLLIFLPDLLKSVKQLKNPPDRPDGPDALPTTEGDADAAPDTPADPQGDNQSSEG